MLKLLILALFPAHLLSQETEGTIMEYYETHELTEQEKIKQKQNLHLSKSTSSKTQVDVSSSYSDASNSIYLSLDTKKSVHKDLYSKNKALLTEYSALKTLLEDLNEKIEDYKNYSESDLTEIKDKVSTMDDYNWLIVKEGTQKVEKKKAEGNDSYYNKGENDDEDEVEEDKDEISLTSVFVIGIGIVVLVVMSGKNSLEKVLDTSFRLPLYTFYENLAILLILNAITVLLYYTDPFSELSFSEVLTGLAVFTLIYAVISVLTLFVCQGFVLTWRKYESQIPDIEDSLKSQEIDLGSAKKALKYYFTKSLFLHSPYIGSIYRIKYFDFSEYLGKCMGQLIHSHFSMTLLGYTLTLTTILLYRVLLLYTYPYESLILLSYPILFTFLLLIVLFKLTSICNKLMPKVTPDSVEDFEIGNFETLPKPSYLNGAIPSLSASPRTCFFLNIHPGKLTCSYLFTKIVPNRHDMLFWLDIFGPQILKYTLQGTNLTLHLWLTLYFLQFIQGSKTNPLLYISPISYLINTLILNPLIIRQLTLSTSIEMHKNKDQIESVQVQQKIFKSFLVLKIYRQAKMIFRNLYMDNKYQDLTEFQKGFIEEIFKIYLKGELLDIFYLEDVLALAGCELQDDELRLFARECKPNAEFKIGLEGFKKAVSVFLRSQKLQPRAVVRILFDGFFEERFGKGLEEAGLEELREFFEEFRWHFTDEDVEEFLVEVLESGVKEMPGMVQDCLECSFK